MKFTVVQAGKAVLVATCKNLAQHNITSATSSVKMCTGYNRARRSDKNLKYDDGDSVNKLSA